jgi:hypothetical protein
MQLDVRGHPLHTRALSVTMAARADGRLDVRGSILDLRKRGFVPVAGDLQPAGTVHDMHLAGVVDPGTRTLASLAAEQRTVAFEPSALTAGESCRDPIARVRELAGARLDGGFSRRLGDALGGPRGCSHVLTLAHFLGATVARALALPLPAGHRPGERVVRRDLVIDGHEPDAGRLALAAQLTELVLAPAPPVARPMDRFAQVLEVRVALDVALPGLDVSGVQASERRRDTETLATAAWTPCTDVVDALAGLRLGAGATATLLARLGDDVARAPHRDVALQLAPALVQCAAALSEPWAAGFQGDPSLVAMGGFPDSCYMWRRDGALDRVRQAEGGPLPRRA